MITATRSDYPSRAFAIFGPIRPFDREFDDLCVRGEAVAIREDLWRRLEANLGDPPRLRTLLASLSAYPIQGVVSFDDDDTLRALLLNDGLGLPRSRLQDASLTALDKAMTYSALRNAGILMPDFIAADGPRALAVALGQLDRPLCEFIVKPSVGTASRGVYRPSSTDTPETVAQRVVDLSDGVASFLVMPFLDGVVGGVEEFCADGVVIDGEVASLSLCEKVKQERHVAYRDRLMVTPPLSASLAAAREQTAAIVQTAVAALGCLQSVFHIEFRFLDDGTPVPIDVALRPGGGLIVEAVRATSGLDLRLCHVAAMLGDSQSLNPIVQAARPSASAVAIGAYYCRAEARPDTIAIERLVYTLRKRPDVLAYHAFCELTDRHWAQPDLGVSIALEGKSAAKAIAAIDDLGRGLELQ